MGTATAITLFCCFNLSVVVGVCNCTGVPNSDILIDAVMSFTALVGVSYPSEVYYEVTYP
jgi:hypothetical protein